MLGKQKRGDKQSSILSAQLAFDIVEWLLEQALVQADAEMILSLADRALERAPIAMCEPISYEHLVRVIEAVRPQL